MTGAEPSLIDRRRRVGWIALACLVLAVAGLVSPNSRDTMWPAAAMRISIVLGALWLSLPTSRRPDAWSSLTRGRLAIIVLVAVFINRVKFVLPLLAAAGIAAWIIRPRKKR